MRQLLSYDTTHGAAWFALAKTLWEKNKDEARQALIMAVAASPNLAAEVRKWAEDLGELPANTRQDRGPLQAAAELYELGLPQRALAVLDSVPGSDPQAALVSRRRIRLLEDCHATMHDVGQALLQALDALAADHGNERRTFLEDVTRVINGQLRLQNYAEALRLADAFIDRCPDFSDTVSLLLARSLHFCIWAQPRDLADRGHRHPDNYFRNEMRGLAGAGHQRLALLPASTICALFLDNESAGLLQEIQLYDNRLHGQTLMGQAILDPASLTPAACDFVLITSETHGHLLHLQLLDKGFPSEKIRDITRGVAAYVDC